MQQQVALTIQLAVRRLSALRILDYLAEKVPGQAPLLASVFISMLGSLAPSKRIVSYLEGIQGCGKFFEQKIQKTVFSLLSRFSMRIQQSETGSKSLLLQAFELRFSVEDFALLLRQVNIF